MHSIAHGDGEGVRGVCRNFAFRHRYLQPEQSINVLLGGPAVSGDGALDLRGGVLTDGNAAFGGDNERDAAGLPHGKGGLDVSSDKRALNGDGVRAQAINNSNELSSQVKESEFKGIITLHTDNVTFNE